MERDGLQPGPSGTEMVARVRHDGHHRGQWITGTAIRRSPVRGLTYHPRADAEADTTILVLDPKGRILSWHAGDELDIGYRPDEVIGAHISVLCTPEDVTLEKPARWLRMAEDGGWHRITHTLMRKDGSAICADVAIAALSDHKLDHTGFVVAMRRRDTQRERMRMAQECAVVAERERLADEMRSGPIHEMFGVSVRLQSIALRMPTPVRDDMQQVISDIDGVIAALRERIFNRAPRP